MTETGYTVGALVAVNALGSATIGDGPHFWAAPYERDDEFGGDPEARLVFPMRVLEAVRAAVGPDFVVGIRMAMDEDLPDGLGLDDAVAVLQRYREHGIDFPDPEFDPNGGARVKINKRLNPEGAKFQAAQKACEKTLPDGPSTSTAGEDEK